MLSAHDAGRRRAAARRAARADPPPRLPLLHRGRVPRSRTPSTTRSCASSRALEARVPRAVTPDSPTQRVAGGADRRPFSRSSTASPCCRSTTPPRPDELREFEARIGRRAARRRASPTCASRRSTAWASRCSTSAAASCAAPRAVTAASARTSPPISGRSARLPMVLRGPLAEVDGARGPRRGVHAARGVRAAQPRRWGGRGGDVRQPAQRRRRRGPPEGSGHHRAPPARHLSLSRGRGRPDSRFTTPLAGAGGAARRRLQDQSAPAARRESIDEVIAVLRARWSPTATRSGTTPTGWW